MQLHERKFFVLEILGNHAIDIVFGFQSWKSIFFLLRTVFKLIYFTIKTQ